MLPIYNWIDFRLAVQCRAVSVLSGNNDDYKYYYQNTEEELVENLSLFRVTPQHLLKTSTQIQQLDIKISAILSLTFL